MNRLSYCVLASLLLVSLPAQAGKGGGSTKVDICHATGAGAWNLISVSENAVDTHLSHGDVLAGAWYPDTDGDGFGDADALPTECPEDGYVDNADDCGDGGAASGPGMEEIADGYDNDCDGDIDEGLLCPCYDASYLDEMTAGLDVYAYAWAARSNGLKEVTSLRGEYWYYNEDDAQWQAPTVGADVYRVKAEDGAPYCETWSQTWLAEPDHEWADDGVGSAQPLSEDGFTACQDVLYDWIDAYSVPLTTW